jgi:hypothetical protein
MNAYNENLSNNLELPDNIKIESKSDDSNKNNGMITKIWGPGLWTALHSITFGYPIEPTKEQKKWYMIHFVSLGHVLPCVYCRNSYQEFITDQNSDTCLKMSDFKSRDALTHWLWRLHNRVNKKLDVDYKVSYSEMCDHYETYRAKCLPKNVHSNGCVVPLDYKRFSYRNYYIKDALIIPSDIDLTLFIKLAILREVNIKYIDTHYILKKKMKDIVSLKKESIWFKRNKNCATLIKRIRMTGTPSIESCGLWEGLPVIDELKLILLFSSTLENKVLKEILAKIQQNENFKKMCNN